MLNEHRLDTVLEEIIARWGIPGLGVGIVKNNEIIYTRYYGLQSLETRAPLTQESIFCVASVAKCFVASAVMQLVEQGKLHLDTPLIDYLPYFGLDDERARQITIHQVLSHTSGMPDFDEREYDMLVANPESDDGAAERLVRSLSRRKLAAAPGERFLYSNIAYDVLGDLIAKISGQSFEDYMKEHILLPAGMPDSTFLLSEVDRRRLAVPHLRTPAMIVNPIYPYHRADAPASFLHSTVKDMCHWCITCLKGGVYKEQRILSPASYEIMWMPVISRGYPPLYEDSGLGWTLGHFNGVKTVSHGGMGFGWTDFLVILPEIKYAAVILCNEESSARDRTVTAIIQGMLGQEPQRGMVSWMMPISHALQEGGIPAAYTCYAELKERGCEEYFFEEGELVNLVYQLTSVGKIDLAIDVLRLNLHAFPEHLESYRMLANLYLQKEELTKAKAAPLTEDIPDIHFMRITATTMNKICDLSETLPPAQRQMVADNVRSIAEAHFSESAWMRAICADDTPIGFIMTHTGSDYEDGIDCPGVFLWRFMIAGPYQGKGYGKRALEKLIQHLKAMGVPRLYTSCGQGEGSPEGFYRKLGFTPTGDHYGDEIEMVLHLNADNSA